jgi:quinoprotein glucose dehydrogenase
VAVPNSIRSAAWWSALGAVALGCARAESPAPVDPPAEAPSPEWSSYGGDPGGSRYSPLAQIDRGNVARLAVAWTARTGDWSHGKTQMEGPATSCARCHRDDYKFEATPIIVDSTLYLSTPFNRVVALDPGSGAVRWRHDPQVELNQDRNEGLVSRGVAFWRDPTRPDTSCGRRVLFGTIDARLLALDALDGRPCADFGPGGTVRLDQDVGTVQVGQYGVTSPPVVVGDVVVVGSSMGDNRRVDMERGVVRAYDVRTGAKRWAWDPIPRSAADPAYAEWSPEAAAKTGGANAWAPLSVDVRRGLVFVPTGSAAPDFYGGERPGSNRYANSVVALEAATGKVVWHFQVIHHDLWDYDVSAQPSLISVPLGGRRHDAVVAATKMGFIHLLDRDTGEPLFPVEERPVPASSVPGERAWPTQPHPTKPKPLHPLGMTEGDLWGATPADLEACRTTFRRMSSAAAFAPPSLEGIIQFPGFGGGINWGGVAWDRDRGLLLVNHLRLPMWVRLTPRERPDRGNQLGTPYTMSRGPFVAPSGLPCVKPPWGLLSAIDLATGELRWERPLGQMPGTDRIPGSDGWGSVTFGGPMVTAGGLVFIASTGDQHLRAFDVETGAELWKAKLPAGGIATPMTYQLGGKQYVVIAAGGHSKTGTDLGDYLVAFALP